MLLLVLASCGIDATGRLAVVDTADAGSFDGGARFDDGGNEAVLPTSRSTPRRARSTSAAASLPACGRRLRAHRTAFHAEAKRTTPGAGGSGPSSGTGKGGDGFEDGASSADRGGDGGSGGCVLLEAASLEVRGTIAANGGEEAAATHRRAPSTARAEAARRVASSSARAAPRSTSPAR